MKLYKIIIILMLLFYNINNSYAYNSDDAIIDFDYIEASSIHEDIFTGGVDFYVDKFCVIDTDGNNQEVNLSLYDGTILIMEKNWQVNECFEVNNIFRDSMKWVNNSTLYGVQHYTSGYYIKEGEVISINSGKDLQKIIIDFLQDDFNIIISIIICYLLFLYILFLCIKYGFRAGVLFYKKNILGLKK